MRHEWLLVCGRNKNLHCCIVLVCQLAVDTNVSTRWCHVCHHFNQKMDLVLAKTHLLFLNPFRSFLLFLWTLPPKASKPQAVHCIVRDVVGILHGSWAEDVHIRLGGFGTRRPLWGFVFTRSLLCRSRVVVLCGWFHRLGGLWRKYKSLTTFKFGYSIDKSGAAW